MNTIYCKKLQKEATQIIRAPFPGEIGERIIKNISAEAWQEWLELQTKIINENRLSPINPEHKDIIKNEMIKFLFNDSDV